MLLRLLLAFGDSIPICNKSKGGTEARKTQTIVKINFFCGKPQQCHADDDTAKVTGRFSPDLQEATNLRCCVGGGGYVFILLSTILALLLLRRF